MGVPCRCVSSGEMDGKSLVSPKKEFRSRHTEETLKDLLKQKVDFIKAELIIK
jgi:hypothetical protein